VNKYTTTYQTPQTRAALVALQLPTSAIKNMWSDAWHYARCIRRAEDSGNFDEACRFIQMSWHVCGEHLTDLALEALDERDRSPRYFAPEGKN
jgi:hypothetical protein